MTKGGQGYNFKGEKAKRIAARLRQIKRDPKAAARLFGNSDPGKDRREGKS